MALLQALFLAAGMATSEAAMANTQCAGVFAGAPTIQRVAGPHYAAGGIHQLFLGSTYRQLWTTPIEVPALDLQNFAGGLTVKERGGGKQTSGLKLDGRDGRSFRFRSTDKRTEVVPKALSDTFVQKVVDDQISAQHPAGAVVVTPLAQAAGIPSVSRCLVVLPDDASLGEFRQEFAGMLGTLEETPRAEPPVTPGLADMTRLAETKELMVLMDASPAERVDARAFLKARLFDMWLGDWDRHHGQWDWGRRKSDGRWQPIPNDRDRAFVNHDGLLMGIARLAAAHIMDFKPEYRRPRGYILNSRDQDRRLLAELDLPAWNEAAAELQARLSDGVIEHAVATMPREFQIADAGRLAAILKARRDRLPRLATDFYRLISDKVDIHATAAHEVAEIQRLAGGEVEVSLATLEDRSAPYFRRRFVPGETREIRVYLNDGNDRVVTSGHGSQGPTVRIIGGHGRDVMEGVRDGIHVYDTEDSPGKVDTRLYEEKLDENGNRPFDWGSSMSVFPTADVETDIGLILGAAVRLQSYGFRAQPYRSRQTFSVETATRTGWRVGYEGEWRRTNSPNQVQLLARYSEIEALRFYGFGNETPLLGSSLFYHVEQKQYLLSPTWVMPRGAATFSMGPVAKYSTTNLGAEHFIGTLRPYGSEDYGQVGAQAGFDVDTREPRNAARKGVRVRAGGSFYPPMWSVKETFGEAHGDAALHVPIPAPLRPSLAFRVGGKRLFGLYPFHEAAYLGGTRSVRGMSRHRFAGDAYAFGNAELRLRLGKIPVILPFNTGIFGLADIGRVFLANETSDHWHSSIGGGLWFSVKDDKYVLSFTSARSEGHVSFYVKSALAF